MRTEVKIGIFIAFVVAGVVVVFLMNQANQGAVSSTVPFSRPDMAEGNDTARPANADRERPTGNGQEAQRQPEQDPRREPALNRPVQPRDPIAEPPSQPRNTARDDSRATRSGPDTATGRNATGPRPSPAVPATQPVYQPPTTREPLTTRPAVTDPQSEPNEPVRKPEPAKPEPTRPTDNTNTRVLPPNRDAPREPTGTESPRRLPPREGPRRHKIVEGDSMWSLAEDYYDNGGLWQRIAEANPEVDPSRLKLGQMLVIPPKEGPVADAQPEPTRPADASPAPRVRKHEWVVERGDSLSSIARNLLGDVGRWREIYELNKDRIENPDVLTPGLVLRIPEE
jgi:nucleoid-associated protein YgaU